MDTFAHGLWGGITFGRPQGHAGVHRIRPFLLAVLFGMAPDILTFGPRFVGWALAGFPDYPVQPGTNGAPAITSLPDYVFTAYNVTHSLIVWALLFFILWGVFRRPVWIFCAWGLHILFDIPTHTTRYFPTPFLWPFKTPYVDGIHWAQPWFMALNYTLIVLFLVYIVMKAFRQRR